MQAVSKAKIHRQPIFKGVPERARQAGVALTAARVAADLRGLRVLVVDGSASRQRFVRAALEGLQMEVVSAGSAEEGWQRLGAGADGGPRPAPRLALIDGSLGGGLSAAGLIRRIGAEARLDGMALVVMAAPTAAPAQNEAAAACAGCLVLTLSTVPTAGGLEAAAKTAAADAAALNGAVLSALGYARRVDGAPADGPAAPAWSGCHLLVVEDDEINQMVARHILEGMGLRVTIAGGGPEAVAMAAGAALTGEPFDAIFMDIGLTGMDGYETAAAIRADRRWAGGRLPIIAMTATTQRDPVRLRAAGLDDFLRKPIDLDQLRAVLDTWLRPAAPAPQAAQAPAEPRPPADRLDTAAALERLGGNRDLYTRLLNLVRLRHAGDAGLIRAALRAGDVPLAHRLAHTLKGVAGTIGAGWLQDAALAVEQATAPGNDPSPAAAARTAAGIDALDAALTAALRALDLELAGSEPRP